MKNIHLLPTDKSSNLAYKIGNISGEECLFRRVDYSFINGGGTRNQNIYITSDEEIKEGDYVICNGVSNTIQRVIEVNKDDELELSKGHCLPRMLCKKIILTTDQDLIPKTCVHNFIHVINDGFQCTKCKKQVLRSKITVSDTTDGVQPIPDELLEWFVKNSSCEEVEIARPNKCKVIGCDLECILFKTCENIYIGYEIIIPTDEPNDFGDIVNQEFFNLMDIPKEEPKREFVNNTSKWNVEDFEESKQETLEEAAERYAEQFMYPEDSDASYDFTEGAKWHQDKMCNSEVIQRIRASKSDAEARRIIRTL